MHGHRSIYCSCDGDCDSAATTVREGSASCGGLEQLFFDQGVDFFMNGHEHDYERMWPTYKDKTDQSNVDPKATIYIGECPCFLQVRNLALAEPDPIVMLPAVSGAAGCSEMHEPFTKPQPPRSAFRSNTFGYSKLWIHNATHVRWQQIVTDPTFFGPDQYGMVVDDTVK